MKLPLSWLQDFIKTKVSPEKIAEALTLSGSEVETIHRRSKDELQRFDKVVVGQILEISKHPNADKLRLTKVTTGKHTLSIVCGAPNIEVGQKVPVALVGADLPNGMKIEKAKIRGAESEGMLCSAKELGLADDHTGIYVLGDDVKIGIPLVKALALDETIFDLDITPNRGDCLSVRGLAREVSAVTDKSVLPHPDFLLKLPQIDLETESEKSRFDLSVRVEDIKDCFKYSARVVYDVEVGESPQWLKNRLLLVGIRPINNIVDVTNYVMMELGQPLHAFDADKVGSKDKKNIVVRRAKKNEKIVALDDKTYDLTPNTLVIAGVEKPVAIAGVMGGRDSAVSTQTSSIILEAATFHPGLIRQASKELGLKSDSSYRFERGIDLFRVEQALGRAVELIEETAGGMRDKRLIVVGKTYKSHSIKTTLQHIATLLGIELSQKEIKSILLSLGFTSVAVSKSSVSALVPSWRNDIQIPEDLAEEIGRVIGYGKISPAPLKSWTPKEDAQRARLRAVREVLLGSGFFEALRYSFYSKEYAELTSTPIAQHFQLENPMSPDQAYLRTSLLPRLFESAEKGIHTQSSFGVFEIGRVFLPSKNVLPDEKVTLGVVLVSEDSAVRNFQKIKGALEALCSRLNIPAGDTVWEKDPHTQAAVISMGGARIGACGMISSKTLERFKLPPTTAWAELSLEALLERARARTSKETRSLSLFPASLRDISLITDQSKTYQEIVGAMKGLSSFLVDIELFDYFDDEKKIGRGKKSMAFHLTFQSLDRTLTGEEVEQALKNIVHHLEKSLGATVRK